MAKREFSAGGIVMKWENKGPKVLLIKDSYGRWTWPKGKINKGEEPEETGIREIREEVGLKNIGIIDKLGENQYFYKLEGKLIFKTVYLYLFKLNGNEELKILHKEIQDGAWFEPREALLKVEYKGAKDLLKKGIALFLKTVQ